LAEQFSICWLVRVSPRCQGSVNLNEVPGYRTELTPFGGIKASGLGVKEGVVEAIHGMTTVKLYTMPWP
jgi:aldehyde dehydrogenase (NAD+)